MFGKKYGLFTNCQLESRKKYSTNLASIYLHEIILEEHDANKSVLYSFLLVQNFKIALRMVGIILALLKAG